MIPLDRLDYAELGFKRKFVRSNYVEIGWNLSGMLPQKRTPVRLPPLCLIDLPACPLRLHRKASTSSDSLRELEESRLVSVR